MKCDCEGTWKHPCAKCYQAQLKARIVEQASGPTAAELALELKRANAPPAAVDAIMLGLKKTAAMDAAASFMRAEVREATTLALLGSYGRGKSVAAAWCMREALRKVGWNNAPTGELSSPVYYLEAGKLTRVSDFDKLDSQWLADLERVKFLVIDDAGDEGGHGGKSALNQLMLFRHNHFRRTVITSNLRKDAFQARYGGALADRIGTARLIELAGVSMRSKPEVRP